MLQQCGCWTVGLTGGLKTVCGRALAGHAYDEGLLAPVLIQCVPAACPCGRGHKKCP